MYEKYPDNTTTSVSLKKLFIKENIPLSEKISTKMVRIAHVLPEGEFIGWQMYIRPKNQVDVTIFGSESLMHDDLKWIAEQTAVTSTVKALNKTIDPNLNHLYELVLPMPEKTQNRPIGFLADISESTSYSPVSSTWPAVYSTEFSNMVRMLRETGACFRVTIGKATPEEQTDCMNMMLNFANKSQLSTSEYLGEPVKTRVLLLLPGKPSLKLQSTIEEAVHGVELRATGKLEDKECLREWMNPLSNPRVLPDHAARIMVMEPTPSETLIGIEQCYEPSAPIPISDNTSDDLTSITIGKAMTLKGTKQDVKLSSTDLKRHYQIMGQTGTGKSTLLSNIILSAIDKGYGLTFIDPHGTTIDTILESLPKTHANRVRVVRIGDTEHPIPLNIWDSSDPFKEEKNISDLCELFMDIFDPKHDGIVGPRYERWLSTFAKASIALLGNRASLESIAILAQSSDTMRKLVPILESRYPALATIINEEYVKDRSSEFNANLSWYLSKFQRLTSVEQLRTTLGAGANSLDYRNTINTNKVNLIDLATPTIGNNAARVIGTFILKKIWDAARNRGSSERTHLVIIDEASLFQTSPLPQMLAESRKFGISLIICNQNSRQFSNTIEESLEANTANVSAFRLSPQDAHITSMRLDDDDLTTLLTRLDAFKAITSISINGKQSQPFTLEIRPPKKQINSNEVADIVQHNSLKELFYPYANLKALSDQEILSKLDQSFKAAMQAKREKYLKDSEFNDNPGIRAV